MKLTYNIKSVRFLLFKFVMLVVTLLAYINMESILINRVILYSILIILSAIYTSKYVYGNILTSYNVFLGFFILFHFGQYFVMIFDSDAYIPLQYLFSKLELMNGLFYFLLCLQIFDLTFFGCQIFVEGKKTYNGNNEIRENRYRKIGYFLGKWIVAILCIPVFYFSLKKMLISLKFGYERLYSYGQDAIYIEPGFVSLANTIFLLGCILISIASKKKNKIWWLSIIFMGIMSVIFFVSGSRGNALVTFLTTLMIILELQEKRFSIKKVIPIIILLFFLMYLASFMSYFRVHSGEVNRIQNAFMFAISHNIVTETLVELGGSISPLIHCMRLFERETLRLGQSYLYSLLIIVPNIGQILGPIHPGAVYSSLLATWLMEQLELPYGPGFSIVAETYYNFGWIGPLFFVVWAYLFVQLFNNKKNYIFAFLKYGTLLLSASLIRGTAGEFVRSFFYGVGMLSLFIWIFAGRRSVIQINTKIVRKNV